MKDFNEWRIQEAGYSYSSQIDGPPLNPHTIAGAENQIRVLAGNIFTTFGIDPRFKEHKQQILAVYEIMEKAANLLGENMSQDERQNPHRYHDVPPRKQRPS